MTVALEPVAEDEENIMDFVELYKKLESLERMVIVQIQHIQQVRLETNEEAYQFGEQLEEAGSALARELA